MNSDMLKVCHVRIPLHVSDRLRWNQERIRHVFVSPVSPFQIFKILYLKRKNKTNKKREDWTGSSCFVEAMFAPPAADSDGPSAPPASMFDSMPGYEGTQSGGGGTVTPCQNLFFFSKVAFVK